MKEKTFNVSIVETLARTIEVEAENELEAENIAKEMYDNEEIVLDFNDLVDTEIKEESQW